MGFMPNMLLDTSKKENPPYPLAETFSNPNAAYSFPKNAFATNREGIFTIWPMYPILFFEEP